MSTLIASLPRQRRPRTPSLAGGEPASLGPLEPVPNWSKLSRADEVTICRDRRRVAAGRVDMVALDGSVFWIIQEDGKGRAMIHQKDGLTVFRKPGRVRRPRHYGN